MQESLLNSSRQVQNALTTMRNEQRNYFDLEKRFDELEMRVNGHLLSGL